MSARRNGRKPASRIRVAGLVTATLMLAAAQPATAGTVPGSSCAHSATATFKPGDPNNVGSGPARIAIEIQAERPWWLEWVVREGYRVCSARVQLGNGSWVGPTRLLPYATPTPSGGEYKEPPSSRVHLRQLVISAARSPTPAGSSCNYPLTSAQTLGGPAGDTKDFSVKVLQPGYHGNGTGLETTSHYQLEVAIHSPNIIICAATMRVLTPNLEGFFRSNLFTDHRVAIAPHGGLSPTILGPLPQGDDVTGQAYARYTHPPGTVALKHSGRTAATTPKAMTQRSVSQARLASATNAEATCPLWSGLDTEGKPTGKSPQAIAISRRLVSTGGGSTEWEVSARPTQAGLALYSGVVEIMTDKPPLGLAVVRVVWMRGLGRELVARFVLGAGQLFRTVVCGHHPTVLPPHTRYTGKGSSCQHPIKSVEAQDYEHYGDQRHIHISLEKGKPPADVTFGVSFQPRIPQLQPEPALFYEVSIRTDPRIALCKAFIDWMNSNAGERGKYRLPLQAHGLASFTVAAYTPWTFAVVVEGRYGSGRP